MNLSRLSTPTLRALYRIAKHPTKGARPFFRDPKAMIALRQEIERRQSYVTFTVPDDALWGHLKALQADVRQNGTIFGYGKRHATTK